MKILSVGFGNVAKETARILVERHRYPKLDLNASVVGIYTQRHGGVEDPGGLDMKSILRRTEEKRTLARDEKDHSLLTPLEAVRTLDYDVLVELSPLSIEGRGEPAATYI